MLATSATEASKHMLGLQTKDKLGCLEATKKRWRAYGIVPTGLCKRTDGTTHALVRHADETVGHLPVG